jgi:hypothetical protein
MKRAMRALVAVVLAAPAIMRAQTVDQGVKPELRLDAIVAEHRSVVEAGGGFQIPAGYYARIGITGAAGAELKSGPGSASGRLDIIGRFLFDPFRQTTWGLSAGAGVSVRAHSGDRVRPYLVTVIDLEGPRASSGFAPAVQVGLGGGVRIGAAIRWGGRGSR